MTQNSLSSDEINRALAGINLSKLAALVDLSSIYSKHIADTAAFQKQIESVTAPLLRLQADYSRLLSQFDVSRLLVAGQALSRLGAQSLAFDQRLIERVTFPAADLAEKMLHHFAPSTQMMAQFQAQFDRVTELVNQSSWAALEPLRQLAERVGQTQAVRDAFVAYGLWLAPSMPQELVQNIVNLHHQGAGSGTVNSVVSRYYAKKNWQLLDRVLDACRYHPNLQRRAEPIRQALQAHRQGLYAVAVPALLLQLEGIAADYVKENKLIPNIGKQTKRIVVAALRNTPCSLVDVRTYAGVSALLFYVERSMYMFVDFNKDHQRLLREKRLIAHAIRHGRQISYGSRMNSLRLFLMIDVLSLLR
jgi:hypothetical protein